MDERGNKYNGWSEGEYRGGRPYNPPKGWIGIGLKVLDHYEDNNWIGHNNIPGEWCIAYHGVGRNQNSENVKKIIGLIFKMGFRPGNSQLHKLCSDINHPGKKVGEGIACTPSIKCSEDYAGISNINDINYKTVIMVRVNPSGIRYCDCNGNDYVTWIVDSEDIRPYRILYKKCD